MNLVDLKPYAMGVFSCHLESGRRMGIVGRGIDIRQCQACFFPQTVPHAKVDILVHLEAVKQLDMLPQATGLSS